MAAAVPYALPSKFESYEYLPERGTKSYNYDAQSTHAQMVVRLACLFDLVSGIERAPTPFCVTPDRMSGL